MALNTFSETGLKPGQDLLSSREQRELSSSDKFLRDVASHYPLLSLLAFLFSDKPVISDYYFGVATTLPLEIGKFATNLSNVKGGIVSDFPTEFRVKADLKRVLQPKLESFIQFKSEVTKKIIESDPELVEGLSALEILLNELISEGDLEATTKKRPWEAAPEARNRTRRRFPTVNLDKVLNQNSQSAKDTSETLAERFYYNKLQQELDLQQDADSRKKVQEAQTKEALAGEQLYRLIELFYKKLLRENAQYFRFYQGAEKIQSEEEFLAQLETTKVIITWAAGHFRHFYFQTPDGHDLSLCWLDKDQLDVYGAANVQMPFQKISTILARTAVNDSAELYTLKKMK
jgi:hypothetical protein